MLIVEMWNGDYDAPNRRDFKCHISVWDELLKLGQLYGWKPMGTIPAKMSYDNWIKSGNFEPDYNPIDYGYVKTFQRKDATNLAMALEIVLDKLKVGQIKTSPLANPPIISNNLTEAEFELTNRGLTAEVLEEFIRFLRKGEFDYTFDD